MDFIPLAVTVLCRVPEQRFIFPCLCIPIRIRFGQEPSVGIVGVTVLCPDILIYLLPPAQDDALRILFISGDTSHVVRHRDRRPLFVIGILCLQSGRQFLRQDVAIFVIRPVYRASAPVFLHDDTFVCIILLNLLRIVCMDGFPDKLLPVITVCDPATVGHRGNSVLPVRIIIHKNVFFPICRLLARDPSPAVILVLHIAFACLVCDMCQIALRRITVCNPPAVWSVFLHQEVITVPECTLSFRTVLDCGKPVPFICKINFQSACQGYLHDLVSLIHIMSLVSAAVLRHCQVSGYLIIGIGVTLQRILQHILAVFLTQGMAFPVPAGVLPVSFLARKFLRVHVRKDYPDMVVRNMRMAFHVVLPVSAQHACPLHGS